MPHIPGSYRSEAFLELNKQQFNSHHGYDARMTGAHHHLSGAGPPPEEFCWEESLRSQRCNVKEHFNLTQTARSKLGQSETRTSSQNRKPPPAWVSIRDQIDWQGPPSSATAETPSSLRAIPSNISLRGSRRTASLLSGASNTSSIKHTLLKPSVSSPQALDAGLPIPPVLITRNSNPAGSPSSSHHHNHKDRQALASIVALAETSYLQDNTLQLDDDSFFSTESNEPGRIIDARKRQGYDNRLSVHSISVPPASLGVWENDVSQQNGNGRKRKPEPRDELSAQPRKLSAKHFPLCQSDMSESTFSPRQAAYWGIPTSSEDSLNPAVQRAGQEVAQNLSIPPVLESFGPKSDKKSLSTTSESSESPVDTATDTSSPPLKLPGRRSSRSRIQATDDLPKHTARTKDDCHRISLLEGLALQMPEREYENIITFHPSSRSSQNINTVELERGKIRISWPFRRMTSSNAAMSSRGSASELQKTGI